MPRVDEELKKIKRQLTQYQEKETELVERIRDTRIVLEEATQSAEGQNSSSRLLNALMIEKRDGRIPGIYGRLVSGGRMAI